MAHDSAVLFLPRWIWVFPARAPMEKEKTKGGQNRARMPATEEMEVKEAEGGAGADGREERRENGRRFNWAGFFRNPFIIAQILLYVCLFYTKLPGLDELGALLVWLLLLLPMCVLNLAGTHKLKELADKRKHQKQA
uniref:Uncharacterized protein n=1 Tax=Arundo donax TaxID=35708 RepID=A0A0A9D572_ARUDO